MTPLDIGQPLLFALVFGIRRAVRILLQVSAGLLNDFDFPSTEPGEDLDFPDTDGDNDPYTVMPVGVEIHTARASIAAVYGYVDLCAMEVNESADLALRIRMIVTDVQSPWDLKYRDVLWGGLKPGADRYDENMDTMNYVTVTRPADTADGKSMIDYYECDG